MHEGIASIPLNQLDPAPQGVRKVKNKASLAELAASIRAHGLLMNLVVRQNGGKRYEVLDGNRRLAALQQLAKAGDLKASHLVPCLVQPKVKAGALAGGGTEISLAANVVRDDMHPADLAEAFRGLVEEQGASVVDIAARFGRSEANVQRLLKVARVAPAVLKTYRDGKLTLAQVQAFTVTDDPKAQERVLKEMRDWDEPGDIRARLTEHEIPIDDGRVAFVTRAAYEQAGGAVREDLFAGVERGGGEDDDTPAGGYIEDPALLDKLVVVKLEHVAKSVAGEGWKWVEVRPRFDYSDKAKFRELHAEAPPLEGKDAVRAAELDKQIDAFYDAEGPDDDAAEKAAEKVIAKLETERAALEKKRGKAKWQPEQLANAGAVIALRRDGKSEITRGLVKPEDRAKIKAEKKPKGAGQGDGGEASGAGAGLSQMLIATLTAQKSAALSATLLERPKVALVAVVYSLVAPLVLDLGPSETPLELNPRQQHFTAVEGSPALKAIQKAQEDWRGVLPSGRDADNGQALWKQLERADTGKLLELLAVCVALTLNGAAVYPGSLDGERMQAVEWIAQAAGLDMTRWFKPTAANYFGRVSKPLILAALTEAKGAAGHGDATLKKGELAALAEREIAGTGWLPEILRVGKA